MQRFIKCINASLIIRQNGETRENDDNDAHHQLWERNVRKKPKFSEISFRNFSFLQHLFFFRSHWSFMVWQRTKPFKNSSGYIRRIPNVRRRPRRKKQDENIAFMCIRRSLEIFLFRVIWNATSQGFACFFRLEVMLDPTPSKHFAFTPYSYP